MDRRPPYSARRGSNGNGDVRRKGAAAILIALTLVGSSLAGPEASGAAEELSPGQRAYLFWQRGYGLHLMGRYEAAAADFRRSIAIHPTAEGHTYLGWSLSNLGRLEEAIAECKKAIPLDPDYGNPYNDIGVYLIELERIEEAVPWLEKAMRAKRYCCYQFPHTNLGRVLLMQGRTREAKRSFERALAYDPEYRPALEGLEYIRKHGLRDI